MSGRPAVALVAIGVAAATFAGCSTTPSAQPPSAPPTTTVGAVLSSESSPVGRIVATGSDLTLYEFASDSRGRSTCITDLCVTLWPPLLVHGAVSIGPGVDRSLVGTIRRPDGSTQVTYGGHPLYSWRGDSKPGYVTGQALLNAGGYWYVVATSGRVITTQFRIGNPASPSSPIG